MTRFSGAVGYGEKLETVPGVWKDVINERKLFGDVLRNTKQNQTGDTVNGNLTVSNTISVVADPYALEHFYQIRYVIWQGMRWRVTNVEVLRPRLVLSLGDPYNGPIPTT